ncbi:hypothetical protein L484_027351 [Morus notabilis]|uniref:Uncharacterized protein n=1 Tax=Morus notabilis TaxID=981085 RepID=W9QK44_9ROSA|nr:hypothetical protein L484_027351 [Morus notabilis]
MAEAAKPKDAFFSLSKLQLPGWDLILLRYKMRLTENVKLPFRESLDSVKPAVSASGFLYAVTTERDGFFAFDWEKESWEVFGLPDQPLSDYDYCKQNNMHVAEYESRLALICMVEDDYVEYKIKSPFSVYSNNCCTNECLL